jgi:CBS-domain-containing membrane protein
MDWVVWVVVAAIAALVGAAYLAGRRRARQVLAGVPWSWALSTEVREVMSTPPRVVREETTLEEAARLMLDEGIGCLPVVDAAGGMVGIVTESDLTGARPWLSLRAWARSQPAEEARRGAPDLEHLGAIRVDEVMTRRVVTAMPGEALSAVVDRMMERKLHHVPVVENGVPVGVLARHDLLGFLARRS